MTRKNIDTSREIRLWTTVVLLATNPEVRDFCKGNFVKATTWTKSLFTSKKKERVNVEHKTVEIKNQQTIDMLKRVNKVEGS